MDNVGKAGLLITNRAIAVPARDSPETEMDPEPADLEDSCHGCQSNAPTQQGLLAEHPGAGEPAGSVKQLLATLSRRLPQ